MAFENQSGTGMSGNTNKQKIMAIAVVIIFVIIIWQIVGLMSNGSSSSSAPASPPPAAKATAAAGDNKSMSTTNPSASSTTANAPVVAAQGAADTNMAGAPPTVVNAITVSHDPLLLKDQQEQQRSYLDSVNQLQLLKVKREIAETNQAIAAARLATATADKNMSDLLTQPAAPQVPLGTYASRLANPGLTGVDTAPSMAPSSGAPSSAASKNAAAAAAAVNFVVISVSMKFQQWSAVLGADGKLYNVMVGDTLVDGSTVKSINKEGVVIEKDGKQKKLSITSLI